MTGAPLEPTREDLEEMVGGALAYLAGFLAARDTAPASDTEPDPDLLARCAAPPPEHGRAFPELLDLFADAAAKGFDPTGPGYLAFVPGGGLVAAAVADFLACGVNRFTGLAAPAPALVALEASVLRWLCRAFGLPPESQGLLTSGGSLSALSAVLAARTARLGDDLRRATLYVSAETHHSLVKAARVAGFPPEAARVVPCTPDLRVDVAALEQAVVADRAAGRRPFLVVGNAGTVNTGAVDDLPALAALAARHRLWFHVDGAYGGFFRLTERGRQRLAGIEAADSVTLDPHKGLFLPYGTGCLLVRDGATLRAAHGSVGSYLQDLAGDPGLPDFAALSPELTRDFRGLRVWLPLHLHGVAAFREALDQKLDLAAAAHRRLAADPHLDVPWVPDLSIVAFRHRSGNDAGRRLLERVNASRRVFLSSTVIDGHYTVRLCILSFRTTRERVEEAVDLVLEAAAA